MKDATFVEKPTDEKMMQLIRAPPHRLGISAQVYAVGKHLKNCAQPVVVLVDRCVSYVNDQASIFLMKFASHLPKNTSITQGHPVGGVAEYTDMGGTE